MLSVGVRMTVSADSHDCYQAIYMTDIGAVMYMLLSDSGDCHQAEFHDFLNFNRVADISRVV